MRAEQRAEFDPHQIDTAPRGILPQELWSRAAAARIFLSSLTLAGGGVIAVEAAKIFTGTNNSIAQAADPECKIRKFIVYGFPFIDNPKEPNRAGLIDPADFITGTGVEFGQANLAILADPKNPNSKRTEYSGNMQILGDHAEVVFKALGVTPNTKGINGKDAAEVLVSFKDDKVRQIDNPSLPPEKAIVVECGQDGVAWGGRYATAEDINKTANNAAKINTVGARVDQLMEEAFGKGRKFGLTPKGDNPQENLKILRASIAEAIKHADEVRRKEKELAKPGSAANVITPTVTITETRPISPTTGTTSTVNVTDELNRIRELSDKAIKSLEGQIGTQKTQLDQIQATLNTLKGKDSSGTPTAGGSIFVLSGLGEWAQLAGDLPAKAVDQITEPDTQNPVRAGINVVGWLLALGLLTNRPRRFSERVWNTAAFPVREVGYRRALRAHAQGLADGTIPAGTPAPVRTHPGPFGI